MHAWSDTVHVRVKAMTTGQGNCSLMKVWQCVQTLSSNDNGQWAINNGNGQLQSVGTFASIAIVWLKLSHCIVCYLVCLFYMKRRDVFPPSLVAPSRRRIDDEQASSYRAAGVDLLKHLQSLYALCKISGKDFSVACYYAAMAGCPGGDFAKFAVPPNQSTGNYQRLLDKVLPQPGPIYYVETPCNDRSKASRSTMQLATLPLHEALARELEQDPSISEMNERASWTPAYDSNELVRAAILEGRPKPHPIAIYMDSVRFSAPLAGRSDSILGIWATNLNTNRRHLLATMRTNDFCRCGCRGWDSVFPLLQSLAWSARCLASGERPVKGHDGVALPEDHALMEQRRSHGESLPLTGVILWIKGDWAEAAHSLGLPTVSSKFEGCPYCSCNSHDMHSLYHRAAIIDWPWADRASYDDRCRAHEIVVAITTPHERDVVSAALAFWKGKKGRGRTVARAIPEFPSLQVGDRLEPSSEVLDNARWEAQPLPIRLTFWRASYIGNACADSVIHRCPIFSPSLCTSPDSTLQVDSLHTLCYGPCMRYSSAVLWRFMFRNHWMFEGSKEVKLQLTCRRLRADLIAWQEGHFGEPVPHEKRLQDLTLNMLGPSAHCDFGTDSHIHPGAKLGTKAVETTVLMDFAIHLLRIYPGVLPHHDELLAAGECLSKVFFLSKTQPLTMPRHVSQQLFDATQRYLMLAEDAQIASTPKTHFMLEAARRVRHHGNFKFYSCFLDESLNLVLRDMAAFAHRSKQSYRILCMMNLLGELGLSEFVFGCCDA